ncbi:MAG: ycf16 [Chlamydiales bacterium]|jgi:Fe-S cluster assembly ATP-binding protein|nr:ycf16 [Chlamydiales bacterium]
MVHIENLYANIEETPILKGVDLTLKPGEIHAIMGPNGAGKSTLAKVIAGHPAYEVKEGSIWLDDMDLLNLEPEERAQKGVFMGFQYPVEVPGVSNVQFLKTAHTAMAKARGQTPLDEQAFEALLLEKMALMEIRPEFKTRNLNEGFSGGEKKRNEILQMAILEPNFAVLDETDSGLDIDALKVVAFGVNQIRKQNPAMKVLLITHYYRLLEYIQPDFVHVMVDGKIVQTGDFSLAMELEKKGYWMAAEESR